MCNIKKSSSNEEVRIESQGAAFPWKLHTILDTAEYDGNKMIVSWLPDNKSFCVFNKEKLINHVLPRHGIKQKHYKSFQRQLVSTLRL